MHYLLFYEVGDDYVSRRAEFRDAHLKRAWEASARGELILGGALTDPVDGAVLLFKGDSPEVAASFARTDPYVTSGVVKRWYVREWTTVVGRDAATPVGREQADSGNKALDETPRPASEIPWNAAQESILRMWKGRSTLERSGAYVHHACERVFPSLRTIEGFSEAYLLRRMAGDIVEFVVLTFWESMDAVRRFAGSDPDRAVVDPEVRAILRDFDEFVTHFEIAGSTQ
jgi:uncharacterized protein